MNRQHMRQQLEVSAWGWFAALASCICLGPLVSEKRYLVIAAGHLVLLVGLGVALRLSRLPRLAVVGAQLLVAIQLVVVTFTDEVLPTLTAYDTLVSRFAAFTDSAQQYASPLPRDADTTMAFAVMVIGAGLLVDVIGVTMRRVPVLGLLFLLIYMVPVAHLGGDVSLWSFVPGAVGFVFMLAADERERLTHWGRQIRTVNAAWQHGEVEVEDSGLVQSRLRIGFGAVAIAAVLPLLLPSVDPQILFDGGSNGTGPGSGDGSVDVDDPTLDMRRNLAQPSGQVLVRVTSRAEPEYFRLAVLDEFNGDVWEVGERLEDNAVSTTDRLPLAAGADDTSIEREAFEVELTDALDTSWLPAPYAPADILIDTPWLVDPINLDVRADSEDATDGANYRVIANIPDPTLVEIDRLADRTSRADLEQFLQLPSEVEMPAIIAQTAREATEGATTPIERALALQDWFRDRGEYTYSLAQVDDDDNRTGLEAVQAFLEERIGYCEQYASAMAIMARQMGIPARVAVGFLRAEPSGDGTWEFRGEDMHSWPELYIEGVGWHRFEPTPPSVSGEAPSFDETEGNTQGQNGREPTTATQPPRDRLPERSADPQAEAGAGGGDGGSPWRTAALVVLAVVAVCLLAATPRVLRSARTRRRWKRATRARTTAEAAWAELRDTAVDLRVAWAEGGTPRHSGRSLREHLGAGATPPVVRSLNQIVLAVERSRYAPSFDDASDLRSAVDDVRAALAGQRSPGQQRLARWLPASLWRPATTRRSRRSTAQPTAGADSVLTLGS